MDDEVSQQVQEEKHLRDGWQFEFNWERDATTDLPNSFTCCRLQLKATSVEGIHNGNFLQPQSKRSSH